MATRIEFSLRSLEDGVQIHHLYKLVAEQLGMRKLAAKVAGTALFIDQICIFGQSYVVWIGKILAVCSWQG